MKKKLNLYIYIFLILITIILPFNVDAMSNPYKSYWQYIEGVKVSNCIYVAWDEAKKNTGQELPYWGLAGRKKDTSWLIKAQKDGFEIGNTARANSIAVYEGHVAYVTSVSEDGKYMYTNQGGVFKREVDEETGEVTITPKNGTGTAYNYKVSAKVGPKSWGSSELFGFIYLDIAPGFVPTTTQAVKESSAPSTSKTTTKEIKTEEVEVTTSTKSITNKITTSKLTEEEHDDILKEINKGKEELNNYNGLFKILILLILAILLLTTYFYKNKTDNVKKTKRH